MENNDDDIELTGGVRRPQNRTSPQRRYLSTTVHDTIDLKSTRDGSLFDNSWAAQMTYRVK